MVLIGLLVLAAVALVLGLVLASTAWLIGSLVASVAAAIVLVRSWGKISGRRKVSGAEEEKPPGEPAGSARPATESRTAAAASIAGAGSPSSPEVLVVSGRPEYHAPGCTRLAGQPGAAIPLTQARADGFLACPVCMSDRAGDGAVDLAESDRGAQPAAGTGAVWVVDGHPAYHLQDCRDLVGRAAEPIPYDQAVEDGFRACSVCDPETARATARKPATPGPPGAAASLPAQVWVVDERPDYHRDTCRETMGAATTVIPRDQAVEDGFTPCPVCTPDSAPPPAARPESARPEPVPVPAAAGEAVELAAVAGSNGRRHDSAPTLAPREVWVVDGYPDYHLQTCRELAGRTSVAIAREQAVGDGFAACAVCRPETSIPSGSSVTPPVADADAATQVLPVAAGTSASVTRANGGGGAVPDEVWVVDGYPDYHRGGCVELAGLDQEPIPRSQAVEDDFAACATCRPDVDAAAPSTPQPSSGQPPSAPPPTRELPLRQPEPVAAGGAGAGVPQPAPAGEPTAGESVSAQVWVVADRPRYHAADCLIIKGQDATAISAADAERRGLQPCSLCQRLFD